jgi:prepilin-type N-terminal cleavage/methylation domain-containing protein
MKKLKAYTLMEVLVVMSIMLIILGVGFNAYASFTENTKFNQDVADLQNDILIMQRAAMLLDRDAGENWIYGIGIDFSGIYAGQGRYTFFKWCSEYSDFGPERTKSIYPSFDPTQDEGNGNGTIPTTLSDSTKCSPSMEDSLSRLTEYGYGSLNLGEDVSIPGAENNYIRFLLFESVSGRTFLYTSSGSRVDISEGRDLEFIFRKNYGQYKMLTVKNLTGRTKITEYIEEDD